MGTDNTMTLSEQATWFFRLRILCVVHCVQSVQGDQYDVVRLSHGCGSERWLH